LNRLLFSSPFRLYPYPQYQKRCLALGADYFSLSPFGADFLKREAVPGGLEAPDHAEISDVSPYF